MGLINKIKTLVISILIYKIYYLHFRNKMNLDKTYNINNTNNNIIIILVNITMCKKKDFRLLKITINASKIKS